jgi:hypothetical protein
MLKQGGDEKENELLAMVHSLLLSIHEPQLQPFKTGQCGGSCIRHLLVKLLRYSGNDAAVCTSKWQGFDKIPGGTWDDNLAYLSMLPTERREHLIKYGVLG